MSSLRAPSRGHFVWRWLVDSPLVVATWISVAMCLLAIVQVARSLREADRVRARSGQVLARIAAEDAATRLVEALPGPAPAAMSIGGVSVRAEVFGNQWLLTVEVGPGESYRFACPRLSGAAPAALGRPLTVVGTAASPFGASVDGARDGVGLPELDASQLARAWRADQVPAFRRDVGIALLQLPSGTECDDFVLDTKRAHLGLAGDAELIVVPGHLWVEPGLNPWRLPLARDLTIVVVGNLYVGRPIEVEGPGRLVFVTRAPRSPEEPCRTAAEGAGNVHLGLSSSPESLSIAAGLVAEGEIILRRTSRVDGPVAVGRGITGSAGSQLVPNGSRLFVAERESVPGFLAAGRSRPGLLRPVEANRGDGEEPLYAAAPGR
jgi:hypothetical protein